MPALGTALGLPFARSGSSFRGPLDAYASGLAGAWSVSRRLLASYSGPLVRVRRSSDNAEQDIGFISSGLLDTAALSSFVGGGNWFLRWAYNQQGSSGRDIGQSSAANQPQGAIGVDGVPYVYAQSAGFTSHVLTSALFAISYTDTTLWSVGQGGAAGTIDLTVRNNAGTERRKAMGPTQLRNDLGGAGTNATISGTTLARYTIIQRVTTSGNRLSNKLTEATGTKVATAGTTSAFIGVGYGAGGTNWMQGAQWLGSALWVSDIGDSSVTAFQEAVKPLFNTL